MSKNLKNQIEASMQGDKCVLSFAGDIGYSYEASADFFTVTMDKLLESGISVLEIRINSFGGSVTDAFEIFNQLERFKGTKTAYIGAVCASAATVIALACEKRIGSTNSLWMIHNPRVYAEGDAKDLEAATKIYNAIRANAVNLYAKATGIDPKKIEKMMDATTWLSAEEALAQGWLTAIGEEPEELQMPDLSDEALAQMQIPIRFIAKMKPLINPNPQNPINMALKERIAATMKLANTLSDDEVAQEVFKIIAERDQLKTELEKKNGEVAQEKAVMLVDKAIAEKRIPEAERTQWLKDATENYEMAARTIAKIPTVKMASHQIIPNQSDSDRTNWTMEDWQKKDWNGLLEMREKDKAKYDALYQMHYGNKP